MQHLAAARRLLGQLSFALSGKHFPRLCHIVELLLMFQSLSLMPPSGGTLWRALGTPKLSA